ncbi:unnamed protein product [Rhizophagus irregularis]|nr:unnamed protein product [Rhizophagus irregularis]
MDETTCKEFPETDENVSDEGTRWTSYRFVQPRYRIGKDGSQRPLHNVSESNTLIESQGCCSNLSMVVEIMESESNRYQLAVAANQGPCEVSSLTEYMMSGVLWPLGNSLEEAKTKPWTGEVAWNIGDDGDIFEFEYYTEAERTTHAFIRQESPEPQKPEEFYKKTQKNKGKKKKNKKTGTVF